jgi:hypothetical protein
MQCTNPVYFSGNKAGSQNAIALVLEWLETRAASKNYRIRIIYVFYVYQ